MHFSASQAEVPHPQTGEAAFPPAAAGECPPRPADPALAAADGSGAAPAGGTDPGQPATVTQGRTAPRLAATGLQALLPVLAVAGLGAGLLLRRRRP